MEIRGLGGLRKITYAESEYYFDYFEEKKLPEDRANETKNARVAKWIGIGLLCVVLVTIGFAFYGCVHLVS